MKVFDPFQLQGGTGPKKSLEALLVVSKSGRLTLNENGLKLMGIELKDQAICIALFDDKGLLLKPVASSDKSGFKWRVAKDKHGGRLVCQASKLVAELARLLDLPFNPGQKTSVKYRVEVHSGDWFQCT